MEKIKVSPGYLVQNTSRATGGITYRRTRRDVEAMGQEGERTYLETTKEIDHLEAVKAVTAVYSATDYAIRKVATITSFGYFVTREALPTLRAAFAELQADGERVNAAARAVGCARRVWVGHVVSELDLAHADTAREVARTVRETLAEVRDALRSGAVTGGGSENALRAPAARAKGLDKLAVGLAGEAVRMALDSIKGAAREIKEAIERGESPESAGRAVELGAIDNAISWFSEESIGEASGSDSSDDGQPLALAAGAA